MQIKHIAKIGVVIIVIVLAIANNVCWAAGFGGYSSRANAAHIQLVVAGIIIIFGMTGLYLHSRFKNKFYLELEKKNDELVKANAEKSKFLSNISHDMRTPMNAIMGMTALAQDAINRPAELAGYLNNIYSASEFLLGLINDVLDSGSIKSGKMKLNPAPFDYGEFAGTMCAMFKPLCENSGLKFNIEADENMPCICVDKLRFNQLFVNLLSNAVRFNSEGGNVTLRLHLVSRDKKFGVYHFEVEDDGVGMSDEFQRQIFKPFSQEKSEIKGQLNGTGLGLSIVKSIVDLMGGKISVKSQRGEGTIFAIDITLPLADETQKCACANVEDTPCLNGYKVLLVEDHPINMQIARRLLEKQGANPICAVNGLQALEIFRNSQDGYFDCVLMDIRMPIMDGLEAASRIRQLNRGDAANVPIIAMTANTLTEDMRSKDDACMSAHLTKPIAPELLYKTIIECIRSAPETQQAI